MTSVLSLYRAKRIFVKGYYPVAPQMPVGSTKRKTTQEKMVTTRQYPLVLSGQAKDVLVMDPSNTVHPSCSTNSMVSPLQTTKILSEWLFRPPQRVTWQRLPVPHSSSLRKSENDITNCSYGSCSGGREKDYLKIRARHYWEKRPSIC